MSELNITQETYDALAATVQDLVELQARNITDRDFTAAVDILNRDNSSIATKQTELSNTITSINQSLNAAIIRFKRYAYDAETLANAAALVPSADQKAAIAGTSGTPSATNKFVTDQDPRLSDDRTPVAHVNTHKSGGSDALSHLDLLDIGVLSHADLELLLAGIQDNVTALGGRQTDTETNVNGLTLWSGNLTLDNIPLGTLYVKPTSAQLGLIPSADQFDALQNALASASNKFITASEATAAYQPVGDYLIPSDLQSINDHLLPSTDGTLDLGSPTNRWRSIHIGSNSLHIGDIHITSDSSGIYINGKLVVTDANFVEYLDDDPRIGSAELHYMSAHDWSMISANTPALSGITASDIAALKGHTHTGVYTTISSLSSLATSGAAPFNLFAKTADLTGGSVALPWAAITGVPILASNKFKGVVSSYNTLPTTGLSNNDVYVTLSSKNSSQLSGVYVVADPSQASRDLIYKAVFDPSTISHSSLTGLLTDSHTQYYNLARLNDYMALESTINSIQSAIGITSVGSGQIITAAERTKLNQSYVHAVTTGNAHNLTARDIGALLDTTGAIGATHLRTGNVNNAISTDNIPQGLVNKYATADMFAAVVSLAAHLASTNTHITSGERSSLLGFGNCDKHYHDADRLMANISGNLDASRINNLETTVASLATIANLVSESHSEIHTLASHNDTETTGAQLDAMFVAHGYGVYSDAHNALFAQSGGTNGISPRIARMDHSHAYATLVQFNALATSNTAQKVHWSNLTGVPQTVGNARTFTTTAALGAAAPVELGEQVVVINYDGNNNWAVYIGVGLAASINSWAQIATQTAGLTYAAAGHTHADYVATANLNSLIDAEIAAYFGLSGNSGKLVSNSDRTSWGTTASSFSTHLGSTLHVTTQNRIDWEAAYSHSVNAGVHLLPAEKLIVSNFDSSVAGASITSGATTKTLSNWLNTLTTGSGVNLINLSGWPSHANATTVNLEKLFDGSNVTTHVHTAYAAVAHTHTVSNITDFNAAVVAYGYLTQAALQTLLGNGTITTTDIHEGANKYLTVANLEALNEFVNLQDHANNADDYKHLAESEVNSLTGGDNTSLHKHEGHHYAYDSEIHVGRHRTSDTDSTLVGTAGCVTSRGLILTESTMPSSTASSIGSLREIRIDDNYIYVKTPTSGWKRASLASFS